MTRTAFALYLLFMCSWFVHLPARIPALGVARVDLLLVCVLTVFVIVTRGETTRSGMQERTGRLLLALFIYAIVTMPLVEWPGSVLRTGLPQFIKAVVFFVFTVSFVTSPRRLRWTLLVFLACEMFRVLEPLYLHLTAGYWGDFASMADWEAMNRLSGAPSDVVNPNGLAFIVLTVIPFLHYCTTRNVAGRLIYLAAAPALLYTLVLTGSRSGMLGLGVIAGLVWLRSRHKILLAVTFAVAVMFTLPHLSADLSDRYLSIVSSHTRNARTAEGRVASISRDFGVAMRRPLFGHGLGTSREANRNFAGVDKPSHDLYTEILEELGVFGLVIFLMFLHSLIAALKRAGGIVRTAPDAAPVVRNLIPALQVWIGMNILFSFASYGLSGNEWYLTAGLVEVAARLAVLPAAAAERANAVPPVRFAAFALGHRP